MTCLLRCSKPLGRLARFTIDSSALAGAALATQILEVGSDTLTS